MQSDDSLAECGILEKISKRIDIQKIIIIGMMLVKPWFLADSCKKWEHYYSQSKVVVS